MKTELAKSSIWEAKEAELNSLLRKIQKVHKELQKQKDSVATIVEEFNTIRTEVQAVLSVKIRQIKATHKNLRLLISELIKTKGFSLDDIFFLKSVQAMMEGILSSVAEASDDKSEDFEAYSSDEEPKAKNVDIFAECIVKPNEQEQQGIRKLLVKLANKFHPDKAKTDAEADDFHDIMQGINEAYARGDYAHLLQIEALYLKGELEMSNSENNSLVFLNQQIENKHKELSLLEDQLARLKQELKQIKKSDIGKNIKKHKKSQKDGSFDEGIIVFDSMYELLTMLTEVLSETKKTKKIDHHKFSMLLNKMTESDGTDADTEEEVDEDELLQLFKEVFPDDMPQKTKKTKSRK